MTTFLLKNKLPGVKIHSIKQGLKMTNKEIIQLLNKYILRRRIGISISFLNFIFWFMIAVWIVKIFDFWLISLPIIGFGYLASKTIRLLDCYNIVIYLKINKITLEDIGNLQEKRQYYINYVYKELLWLEKKERKNHD